MVRWLHDSGIAIEAGLGALGDPAHAILTLDAAKTDVSAQIDASIVCGLHGSFGEAPFTTGEARQLFTRGRMLAERGVSADDIEEPIEGAAVMFFEAVASLKPDYARATQGVSTQSLAAILGNRQRRRIGEMRIEVVGENARTKTWRIAID